MSGSVEKTEGASLDAGHAGEANEKPKQGISSSRGSLSEGDHYDSKEDKRLLRKIDGRFVNIYMFYPPQ